MKSQIKLSRETIPKPIKATVFLSLEKALQDEIILEGGIKLYLAAEYNAEWNATVTGKILSLPQLAPPKLKHIYDQLNIGDEVCFSYSVVSDRGFASGGALFEQITEDNRFFKEYRNGKGEKLRIVAVRNRFNEPIWTGMHFDKKGIFTGNSRQGKESDMESWISQFPMGKNQKMAFRNLYNYQKNSWWKVSMENIFAKKEGDNIVSLSDRVICKPIEHKISPEMLQLNGIHLPTNDVKMRLYDRATVVCDADDIEVKKGDVVSMQQEYVEKYNIWGEEYFLIKKSRVLGKYTT